ncbi:MAG: hypothetical protein IPP42_12420 [Saprospiraceae bacterium]|nr:hypothetical protein [Saprospiraceae bacterium]
MATDPDHEMQLHEQFKIEFYEHYQRVKNHIGRQPLKAEPLPNGKKNILESNLELQEDLINEMNKPGLTPDFLTVQAKAMRSIGGIMVGLLSDYFRESKEQILGSQRI